MEGFIKNRLSYFEDPLTSLHAMHALGNTLTHDIFIVYIYVQGVTKKVKKSIHLVLHLKKVKMLF